jgi:hypothetical protein
MNPTKTLLILLIFFLGLFTGWGGVRHLHGKVMMKKVVSLPVGPERLNLMRDLALKVGPEEAINLLNRSSLPKYGETHLLAHSIGEAAYKMHQKEALPYCQNDYLNGCAHGLILSAIADIGFEGVKEMVYNCQNFSPFKYQMCLHAAGHAFLAVSDYQDLPHALESCDRLKRTEQDSDILHCYNGVFMENSIGEHNGATVNDKPWLKSTDLLFPCNALGEDYKGSCYLNQTGWWFRHFGGDMTKVVSICQQKVPEKNQLNCANDIGRVISTLTQNDLYLVRKGCDLFSDVNLRDECFNAIAQSVFALGDEQLPFTLCREITTTEGKGRCYTQLNYQFTANNLDLEKIDSLCQQFEDSYQQICAQ